MHLKRFVKITCFIDNRKSRINLSQAAGKLFSIKEFTCSFFMVLYLDRYIRIKIEP